MADFKEYGQHYPDRETVHDDLRSSGESALVFDREHGVYEAWVDGRMIARGSNQIHVGNAFHQYDDARLHLGDVSAQSAFPDLTGHHDRSSPQERAAYIERREREAEKARKQLEKMIKKGPFGSQ